jgi:hypothetical protein
VCVWCVCGICCLCLGVCGVKVLRSVVYVCVCVCVRMCVCGCVVRVLCVYVCDIRFSHEVKIVYWGSLRRGHQNKILGLTK